MDTGSVGCVGGGRKFGFPPMPFPPLPCILAVVGRGRAADGVCG